MPPGEANMKAIAFRLPEKFSALRASPLAFQSHRLPPSHRVLGTGIFPLVTTIFTGKRGKRNDRILTDS